MTVILSAQEPFAQGGNRLCFVHPEDDQRCIKVRRPDFTLEDRRRKKGFPKNLKPLSSFDDNREEYLVMQQLMRTYGERVFQHISRCFGFVETDLGKGLVSELIRDYDGAISQTLKKYLWDHGLTDDANRAINDLCKFWEQETVPSRDLLLHNIVVQQRQEGEISRLVVIDGLGSAGLIPFHWLPTFKQKRKVGRKTTNLHERVKELLSQRGQDNFPGYHGLLLHNGQQELKNEKAQSHSKQ
ncbi:MAG: YrbL family protein [Marinobacter sp.]